ncbi:hypothetical protein CEUSTIGMA_g4764.t1 [Chlamydomonas eustigma]|uniref:Malonyl-CoA decarboxylase C-terminal domain-containing protein n=1 Tax=Chlamydomonas eustigma TaxID=1157962 RepID=A0A250X2M6_9CHLO|nr:hypothetical protein CEUSTIGMA_g4764.t1 [Chlamydomonas eustigma]|eukprot:GAX77318.1 hypothetical protein CEUSTIGMA_g4764.t1 [Chlamydomonas eustigma]
MWGLRKSQSTWKIILQEPLSQGLRCASNGLIDQRILMEQWIKVFEKYTESRQQPVEPSHPPEAILKYKHSVSHAHESLIPHNNLSSKNESSPGCTVATTLPATSNTKEGTPDSVPHSKNLGQAQQQLCEMFRVFSSRLQGSTLPEQFCQQFMAFYQHVLRPDDKPWFLRLICSDLGLSVPEIDRAIGRWKAALDRIDTGGLQPREALQRAAEKLGGSTRPLYIHLLISLSQFEEGIHFLVQLRSDLISIIRSEPAFSGDMRSMSEHLRQALAGWFSPGLLKLQRICWDTCSGEMLEKIMKYEAVHPMKSWLDLRRRLSPVDRRVYAFTHPCLPGEPLVVLHTALAQKPAQAMTELLTYYDDTAPSPVNLKDPLESSPGPSVPLTVQTISPQQEPNVHPVLPHPPYRFYSGHHEHQGVPFLPSTASSCDYDVTAAPKVAVFYSISSTQPGLSGVDLGHFLIKKVVDKVKAEFPSIDLLVTLSPVPNLRDWLMSRLAYESSDDNRKQTATTQISSNLISQDDGVFLLEAIYDGLRQDSQKQMMLAAAGLIQSYGAANSHVKGQKPSRPVAAVTALTAAQRASLMIAWLKEDRWRLLSEDAPHQAAIFRRLLLRLTARYLVQERRRNLALDSVANFHLRNGATLWRINWGADISPKGLASSLGIMVNYRYDLSDIYQRNQDYVLHNQVHASEEVLALLKGA